jgi:nucleotide-binding universal stress UspA family protein
MCAKEWEEKSWTGFTGWTGLPEKHFAELLGILLILSKKGASVMSAETTSPIKDKHILIAVDETESSKRAVLYVADILGGFPGFRVTLLRVIPEPEEDFFDTAEEQAAWTRKNLEAARAMLENYRQILNQAGFPPDKIQIRACVGEAKEFADVILEAQRGMESCTVVVGRHHKTKTEEFLFGSTSTRLIHEARNCAIWVVE